MIGLRARRVDLRYAGAGTLFLVAGKLVVVDLANVDALIRIVLFMAFGAVFLAFGYFFPELWRETERDATTPDAKASGLPIDDG